MPVDGPEPTGTVVDGRAVGLVTAIVVILCTLVVLVLRPASFADRVLSLVVGVGLATVIVLSARRRNVVADEDVLARRRQAGLVTDGPTHPVIPPDLVTPGLDATSSPAGTTPAPASPVVGAAATAAQPPPPGPNLSATSGPGAGPAGIPPAAAPPPSSGPARAPSPPTLPPAPTGGPSGLPGPAATAASETGRGPAATAPANTADAAAGRGTSAAAPKPGAIEGPAGAGPAPVRRQASRPRREG